jgi:hypothetical protein
MKISRYLSIRKSRSFPLHSIWFDVSWNGIMGGNQTPYDNDTDVFQHQVRVWSISRGIVAKMVQHVAPVDFRPTNSHKLEISSRWPILGFRLGDLVGGFRLQFHIMKSSFDAENILLNIASEPHDPVLQNESQQPENIG